MNTTIRINTVRQRMLAACIAAVCATAVPEVQAALPKAGMALDTSRVPDITVTNCDDSGPGSLRDALNGASDGDIIDLTQLACSTISLTTGALIFGASDVAVIGPGRFDLTVDASGSQGYAAFYDLGGGTLHLANMTITGGSKYRSDVDAKGGCVHTEANVELDNVAVQFCFAQASPYSALGGGVFAGGFAYLRDSTIYANFTVANLYASGGGVYALGGMQAMYSTIEGNFVVPGVSTPSFGGGAFVRGGAFILGTTIDANFSVSGRMGGLALADNNGTPSTIINSTISGNFADRIGGVFARESLSLYNSTIAFNNSHVWSDGPGSYLAAGLYVTVPGVMYSSILANNVNSDPAAPQPTADLTGAAGSGFNGSNNNIMFAGTPAPTDTSHEDPGLHPLADNGGLTKTHVPTPGIWDTFGGVNPLSLPYDQRGPGFARQSSGDFPEIGALQINSDIIFANGFN